MPLAKIEVRKSRPAEEVSALIEAVYRPNEKRSKCPRVIVKSVTLSTNPSTLPCLLEKRKIIRWLKLPCFPEGHWKQKALFINLL